MVDLENVWVVVETVNCVYAMHVEPHGALLDYMAIQDTGVLEQVPHGAIQYQLLINKLSQQ